jgi:integrase
MFLDALQDLVDEDTVIPSRFTDVSLSSRAFEKKKSLSMLYHIYKSKSKQGPQAAGPRSSQSIRVGHKHKPFPADTLVRLISEGCRLQKSNKDFYDANGRPTLASEFNLNLLMALLLMAGAGLRKSELFHLFIEDIHENVVWVYHPEAGMSATGRRRRDVLREDYGLLPRNKISGTKKAGFKGFLIVDGARKRSRLHFLPSYERLFFQVFKEYRRHVMPNAPNHPYLFVSTDVRYYGDPWSIDALNDAFKKALVRIDASQSKHDATTPHGLRHGYCQSLINMKMSPIIIQQCMHHTTLDAQKQYSFPSDLQVNTALQKAAEIMTAKHEDRPMLLNDVETPDLLGQKYKSDPAGLFAPHSLGAGNDRI